MQNRNLAFSVLLASILILSLAGIATATADTTIKMNGFFSTSLFVQDQEFVFGNGQNAELPSTSNSNNLSGVDIRNSRVWWTISGATLSNGWTTGGRLEADFFGGFNGSSPFSSSQATPRLRQAVFTLTSPDGVNSFSIGQQWELMFPLYSVPKSLTHVAFPLGFGTGMIGWRYPGVVYHHKFTTAGNDGGDWRLDVGAFSGQWEGPGSNTNFDTAGNVDLRPQMEGRLYYNKGDLTAYGTLYFSNQDLTGVSGTAPTPITDSISSWGGTFGWAWHPQSWSLVGAVYAGKGIGQLFGSMFQFGDISTKGGYVQGGYKFTPNWSGYVSYAMDKPNADDVITWMGYGSSGRLKGQQTAADLIYSDGPFDIGFEFMHASLEMTTNGTDRITNDGNQISVGAMYHF